MPSVRRLFASPFAKELLLLLVILAGALALRLHALTAQSFWHDELLTVELTLGRGHAHNQVPHDVLIDPPPRLTELRYARPPWAVWFGEFRELHPPFYALLMRGWGELFGQGDAAARSFSVVAGVLAVGMLFVVARMLNGPAAALWSAALLAVAGAHIQYSQEARDYALLVLLALIAAAALVRIETAGPTWRRVVALAAAVAAMMLTHYFAIGTVAALALYASLRLRGAARRRTAIAFATGALIFAVVWGSQLPRQVRLLRESAHVADFVRDDGPGGTMRTLTRAALIPVRLLVEPQLRAQYLALPGGLAYFAFILALRRRRDLLLWALWLPLTVLPVALLDIARHTKHLELIRYTILAVPAVCAIIAASLRDAAGWRRHVAPAVVLASCLIVLPAPYHAWWKPNWKALAAAARTHLHPGDVLVISNGSDPSSQYAGIVLLAMDHYLGDRMPAVALLNHRPDAALAAQLGRAATLFYVDYPLDPGPGEMFPGATVELIATEPAAGRLFKVKLPPK